MITTGCVAGGAILPMSGIGDGGAKGIFTSGGDFSVGQALLGRVHPRAASAADSAIAAPAVARRPRRLAAALTPQSRVVTVPSARR